MTGSRRLTSCTQISGSLNVNNLLALPSGYASEDIPNKDKNEVDDFLILSHDDASDGSVASDTLCALADEDCPTSLPADNTAAKNDVMEVSNS